MYQNQPSAPKRSHTARNVALIIAGAVLVLLISGGVLGSLTGPSSPSHVTKPATATTFSPQPAPSTPAVSPHVTRIHFIVTGNAPGGVDITYGSDADNRSPKGGLGFDGSGTAIPWRGSMRFRGDAQYYQFDAQLQGGGDITCKIVVTGPGIQPLTVSSGHASGQYNICSAQAAPSDPQGRSWDNEG